MHLASVGRNGKRLFKGKEDKTVKEIQIQLPIAALNDWLEGWGEGVSWLAYDDHLKLSSIHETVWISDGQIHTNWSSGGWRIGINSFYGILSGVALLI